jgi:glycosyltransferase involved in cell wall biosynthesis
MSFSASLRARLWRIAQLPWVASYRKELAMILARHGGDTNRVIIFTPGLDWQKQLFQRPQHLALALAQQEALVFYFEPEESNRPAGFHQEAQNLYLCHVPLSTFGDLPGLWVHSFTWNQKYIRAFRQPRLIYDFVDDLGAFQGQRAQLERQHAELLRDASLVLVTAERLRAQVAAQRPDAILCPNGVDYAHFVPVERSTPTDLAPILAAGGPIAGYYGALASWFDYDLLRQAAGLKPDWQFVLIGPDHDGSLAASGLLQSPNVHWLGRKSYAELPAYLACFDVALIPFVVNDITHATSPLKLFEYMAGGKPMVVTPMQESMRYAGVLVAATPAEFSARLDEALASRNDPDYLALLERMAQENTWDARARQILAAMNKG